MNGDENRDKNCEDAKLYNATVLISRLNVDEIASHSKSRP